MRAGLTQTALASEVGTFQAVISKIESDGMTVKAQDIPLYAKALGVEPGFFFEKVA